MENAMRLFMLLIFGGTLLTSSANAFNLDGFSNGMTKPEVLAKLASMGLIPKPKHQFISDIDSIESWVYNLSFCKDGKLFHITKSADIREFNTYLLSMISSNGNPKVGIPSVRDDIIYLDWELADGNNYRLATGVNFDDTPFHNIVALDNVAASSGHC
jgi:hypothetical protein